MRPKRSSESGPIVFNVLYFAMSNRWWESCYFRSNRTALQQWPSRPQGVRINLPWVQI